jgi:hypothetical protein
MKAANELPPDAEVEQLDEDWVAHFFKQCDTVSNDNMQSIWAKVLSGEATKTGSFTKRTVNFIASMDKNDAELFTKFCQFVFDSGKKIPLVLNADEPIIKNSNINFSDLIHLSKIGLIDFDGTSGFALNLPPRATKLRYMDTILLLDNKSEKMKKLKYGQCTMTQIGSELFHICGAKKNEEFLQYSIDYFKKAGLNVQSIPYKLFDLLQKQADIQKEK